MAIASVPRVAEGATRETGDGLLAAAALIGASGLASRVLGLYRDRLLADRFGAGEVLDAYFAAYRIPDLLYNLLIVGALSAAFLPVISRYLSNGPAGRESAFRTANALLTLTVLLLAGIAAVLFVTTPAFVRILAPGFPVASRDLTADFTRIMLLQPILLGISSVVGSLLLSFHRFLAYAAAPVLYNAGIIAGVVLFVPALGHRGLAWGVVTGALLHLLIQLPALWKTGFRFRPTMVIQHEGVKAVSQLFFPRLVGLIAGQVGAVLVTVLGSRLAAGSISAYSLAENLQAVPIGIVGISMAVAAFPFLAAAAARQDVPGYLATLTRALRVTFAVALPASIFLVLLRAQIVRVILGTGAFDWHDTTLTYTALSILALSVVAQSIIPILARAFFALHDTRTPMLVSLIAIAVNVAGALLLTPRLGVAGLAWAFTAAAAAHFLILLTVLHVRLGELEDVELLRSFGRIAIATVVAGFCIQGPALLLTHAGIDLARVPPALAAVLLGFKGVIAYNVNMQTFVGVATQLVGSLLGGALVFLATAMLLGAHEPKLVLDFLRSGRLRRSRHAV